MIYDKEHKIMFKICKENIEANLVDVMYDNYTS